MSWIEKSVRIRVAGVLVQDDKLLMIAHRKKKEIYWLLPGGGVKFGESLPEALKREFREELNISIEVKALALVIDSIEPSGKRHILNVCFHCAYSDGNYAIGHENRLYDFRFLTREELRSSVIFPPINQDLVSLLDHTEREASYLGKIWQS